MDAIDLKRLSDFVRHRQNEDCGFAFCKPLPSTLAETFYAVSILTSIGEDVPRREKVVEFLKSRIQTEINSLFYTLHSLNLLGEDLPDYSSFLLKRLEGLKAERKYLLSDGGVTATYTFLQPNALRDAYMISTLLHLYNRDVPEETKMLVRRYRRETEFGVGYGVKKPNLEETFYASYILRDKAVISFVKSFESKGGFAKQPGGYPPYLEDTYYATSTLSLLSQRYSNPRTAEFIASLQNANGGFRRSIHGGISTLEDSYYAVEVLRRLEFR